MIVHQIPVGQMQNFTYVVMYESTRECIIIDLFVGFRKGNGCNKKQITQTSLYSKYAPSL